MVQYSMKQDGDNHQLVHQSAASKADDSMTPEEIAYRDHSASFGARLPLAQ
jgi:hypothetical protein